MLISVNPKLPSRNITITKDYYINQLGFSEIADYSDYLLLEKENVEIHFFSFKDLSINDNFGQVYIRTNNIDELYQSLLERNVSIHPNGALTIKPWGQKEFSLLDPDNNLLTFGQTI